MAGLMGLEEQVCAGCRKTGSVVGHRWSLQGRKVWEELLTCPPGTGSHHPLPWARKEPGGNLVEARQSPSAPDPMPLAMPSTGLSGVGWHQLPRPGQGIEVRAGPLGHPV